MKKVEKRKYESKCGFFFMLLRICWGICSVSYLWTKYLWRIWCTEEVSMEALGLSWKPWRWGVRDLGLGSVAGRTMSLISSQPHIPWTDWVAVRWWKKQLSCQHLLVLTVSQVCVDHFTCIISFNSHNHQWNVQLRSFFDSWRSRISKGLSGQYPQSHG